MKPIDYMLMGCGALVLILIGVSVLPSGPSQQLLDNAYEKSCTQLMRTCNAASVKTMVALKSGQAVYTLGNLCAQRGYDTTVSCANSCGCNLTSTRNEVLFSTPLKAFSSNPMTEGTIILEEYDEEI